MNKLPELKAILRENKIKGWSHFSKPQLVDLLKENNLLPEPEPEKVVKEIDPKWERLRSIRKAPRPVTLTDVKTGEELTFSSIYKASKHINHSPRTITFWNGKVWNNMYKVCV